MEYDLLRTSMSSKLQIKSSPENYVGEVYQLVRHRQNQFGFRKNRSETLQLLLFRDTVYKNFDKKDTVNKEAVRDLNILYIDFVKAFDTVPYKVLIQKLHNIRLNWC